MKNILFVFVLFVSLSSSSQTIKYSHKPATVNGCVVRLNVSKQDTLFSITVTLSSEGLFFAKEPVMMIKTFEGEVLRLKGMSYGNDKETGYFFVSGVMVPLSSSKSIAQFPITSKQMELLNQGVSKVSLSTLPIVHEKNFNKDKIGKKLYNSYLKEKEKEF